MIVEVKELLTRAQEKGPCATVSHTVLKMLHIVDWLDDECRMVEKSDLGGSSMEIDGATARSASTVSRFGWDNGDNNMTVNVNDKIKRLKLAQRRKVKARATELVTQEMTLRKLRRARRLR